MVFAPVDSSIREKIVAAYLAGKGRNQIDRELRKQGVKVSHGSISNFINTYKREHEQPPSTSMVDNVRSLTDDSPSSNSGDGLVNVSNEQGDVDFNSQPYETQTDTLLADADYNPALDGESGERLLNYTDDDQQVHVSDPKKPDISDTRHDSYIIKEIKEIKEPIVKKIQTRPGLSQPLGLGIDCTKTVNQDEEEEIDFSDSPANLNIEKKGFLLYSDPAVIWPRLLKQIKHEKDQRHHEMLVLERKKKILDIREDQINHDLEQLEWIRLEISAREAEAEPLLSLARQFQSMGLDFDSLLPYIENLREQAARGIDFKTAATFMV